MGKEAEEVFQRTKAARKLPQRHTKLPKRRVDTRLKFTDPW